MSFKDEKFSRFQDWTSQTSMNSDRQLIESDENYSRSHTSKLRYILERITRILLWGYEGFKSIRRSIMNFENESTTTETKCEKKVLDPQGQFLQKWNKIFLLSCVIAVSLDPWFFYTPVIDYVKNCIGVDTKLETAACILRFFTDIFYILHITFQFRTGFIAPSSRVFGRGILVKDPILIAKRYLSSYFIIDILAVLPLPQMVILVIIPVLGGSAPLNTKNLLRFIVLLQYIPRCVRMYPLYKEVTKTSGIITETAFVGAIFNLLLFMLAAHIYGAIWYLFSIERADTCWRRACRNTTGCVISNLYCGTTSKEGGNPFLSVSCPIAQPNTTLFDFGIYLDALQSVVDSGDLPSKFFYCLLWGLRSLSSLGQTLQTSTYIWEICFAASMSIAGLVLFALIIGNVQTYLQSNTIRLEEMRVKRRDAEQWMSHRLLPENLRQRIRRYEQYKWQETRGVDEGNLLGNLPKDLRRDIKRHLCLALLMRVPMFEKMDEQLLDAMCDRLKPALCTEESFIIREGDPVDEMIFIMRGKLLTVTTDGGRTGFFNSEYLKGGDFCGEELLTWALDPNTSSHLPISTRTVRALTEVEGFALLADDLKFVASQFRRLHSKKLRHTFRFYSQHWRTWAASYIQASWRRYCKKKMEDNLREEENRLQNALGKSSGSSPSLGATIYASRFAANALRALRRNKSARRERMKDRLPPLLLQKPAEPDFTADND